MRKPLVNVARRIDYRGNTVVGGADQPAAIFHRAHAGDLQVLLARRAMPEIAVIGNVHQQIRAAFHELADFLGEHRFVADEHAQPMRRP